MQRNITIPAQSEQSLIIRTSTEVAGAHVENDTQSYEIVVEENAQLSLTYFENRPREESSNVKLSITLEKNAQLSLMTVFTGAGESELKLAITHAGAGSSSKQKTLFFGDHTQNFNIQSVTTLDATDCSTEILAKGVLNDTATARFDGSIHITHNGKDSNGHLHEHTLLLSSGAKINAIPALKIENNNVQASHSASVTRIDDEHLFYCSSRGIDEATATRIIVDGFLGELYRETTIAAEIDPLIAHKIERLTYA